MKRNLKAEIEKIIIDNEMLGEASYTANKIITLFSDTVDEIIDTPLRSGDGTENDDIVEDGIQEALLRQQQRAKTKELGL